MAKIIGTIDLGSNSFYMLISKILEDGTNVKLYTEKYKVQLRSGLSSNGLSSVAQEKALDCFHKFKLSIDKYKVNKIIIAGTYTLRKAKDHIQEFIKKSEAILGAKINILTGEEEARMVYLGASSDMRIRRKMLVIDIGGGTTDLAIFKDGIIRHTAYVFFGLLHCFAKILLFSPTLGNKKIVS